MSLYRASQHPTGLFGWELCYYCGAWLWLAGTRIDAPTQVEVCYNINDCDRRMSRRLERRRKASFAIEGGGR